MRRSSCFLLFAALAAACSPDSLDESHPSPHPHHPPSPKPDPPYVPPPEACTPPDLDAPDKFPGCNTGSGIFGTWIVDDLGLPAYFYGLDENRDQRAGYFNTEGKGWRTHWAQFGNGRVTALAYNDGYVEVTHQDRGETFLNAFDETKGNVAGGFSYLDDGDATWSTAYAWRPLGSKTTRVFGTTYAEATMSYRDVRVVRRTFAPAGDALAVVDEVTLENTSEKKKSLRHYEVWDVGRRPIEINWVVSGIPFSTVPGAARDARDKRNGLFDETVSWDAGRRILGLRRTHASGVTPPARTDPNPVDYYPADPYVAVLLGEASDTYTTQGAFFGKDGFAAPSAVTKRATGDGASDGPIGAKQNGDGQPRMLTVRSDVELAPGETKTLRFAFGGVSMGDAWFVDPAWTDPSRDLRAEATDALRPNLALFATTDNPVLHRELTWHAAMLEAATGRREYWDTHVVPQGSAYLFLHGADGAARDLSLFAVPLVYTHPSLAREELAMNMMITFGADKSMSYAFQGHGMLDDALGFHKDPSDLTIFFLFAIGEYLGATGDLAFLDAPMPYYPLASVPGATVYDHVRDAVRYLFDVMSPGPHGLVRLSTGDWNDGIDLEGSDHDLAVAQGESVPNTQMAAAVLPRIADLVEPRDAALAAEIRTRAQGFASAAATTWTGQFFGRAYFGDGVLAHANDITLEAQVWGLIGGTFQQPADRDTLVAAIKTQLDDPSPAGALLAPKGQVWPAIASLLTWGYALSDSDLAFRQLARGTMAAHAVAYPDVWYGIWDGPDGLNGPDGDMAGQAWYSQVTPMTDFPVTNANQHAMPLLGAIRLAGIEATANGLCVAPRVPGRMFSLRTSLIDVDQRAATLTGSYRPLAGPRTLEIEAPSGSVIASAELDGAPVVVPPGSASITLTVQAAAQFSVTMSP